MKKSIILHSGGIDSTILAEKIKKENQNLTSLYFDFGHNSSKKELEAVRATSGIMDLKTDVINMSTIRNTFVSSDLAVMAVQPNPGKHVLELGGFLLLGPALTYAHQCGYEKIYIGYTKLDANYSKEYSTEFLEAFSELTVKAGYSKIKIEAPFINTNKEDVLKFGENQLELLKLTWSCINDFDFHCGTCQACQSRKNAFENAGVADPTIYLK